MHLLAGPADDVASVPFRVVPIRICLPDPNGRATHRPRLVEHGHRAVCQAIMREMHGTLLCCQISVIKTDQEVVEYRMTAASMSGSTALRID